MKKITKIVIAAVMLILCFTVSACENKYVIHYSATLMVRKNTTSEVSVSFSTFSGIYVMQLKNTGDEKTFITYNATLEEGNIKVYYDFKDEKLNLFEIGTDGSIEGQTETFTSNKTIYIIIESDGKCKAGSFSFALEKSE